MKPGAAALTIFWGAVLLVVLAPLSQFLTLMTVNADIETATPVGWAVGILFTLALAWIVLRALARTEWLDRRHLVLLYCMLTIGVPVMNLGVVRQVYLAMHTVLNEYLANGNSTYRLAYASLNPSWFPVVPDDPSLAWIKTDRLLRFLQNPADYQARQKALQELTRELGSLTAGQAMPGAAALIERLGLDELETVLGQKTFVEKAREAGILGLLETRLAVARQESSRAAEVLKRELGTVDEEVLNHTEFVSKRLDRSSLDRLRTVRNRMTPEEKAGLEARLAAIADRLPVWIQLSGVLGTGDFANVRAHLAGMKADQLASMRDAERASIRADMVYRMTRAERQALLQMDGAGGTPNLNLLAFTTSIWQELSAEQARKSLSFTAQIEQVIGKIPWHLWWRPTLMWFFLLVVIFIFLMSLTEWLRRKWVDRENLAFPLVEAADHIIRHDFKLETAEDVRQPEKRATLFNPLFLVGIAAGFLYLSAEALSHYEITNQDLRFSFDFSKQVFTDGFFKGFTGVFFTLSPVVLGVAFLVNLEVSLSVWVSFFVFKLIEATVRNGVGENALRASEYTGYGGGRFFPFAMEQLLGACVCFFLLMMWKMFRSGGNAKVPGQEKNAYLPFRWNWTIMGISALATFLLLWNYGLTHAGFLLVLAFIVLAQTLTAARVRAETGLHTHHVSYEFSKLPMVFGMTGWTGGKVYTLFTSITFLPVTLLFRTLPQQLENLELARRFQLGYRTVAWATLAGFCVALAAGMMSFLVFAHHFGAAFHGSSVFPGQGVASSSGIAAYPLYVSHFLGENGLESFTRIHPLRIIFMAVGFGVVALLAFLRHRFLRFPIQPVGYLVILLSIYYSWISPYVKGEPGVTETTYLWGSVFTAWLVKTLVIKYGGMNSYKAAKPLFVGLIVGATLAVFGWNVVDLACSITAESGRGEAGTFIKYFLDKPPYSPRFY